MINFKELHTGKLWCQMPPYRVIASTQDENLAGTGTNALPDLAFTEGLPVDCPGIIQSNAL